MMPLLSTFKLYDNAILLSHAMTWLSGSIDIPVSESTGHTDCSTTSLTISDGNDFSSIILRVIQVIAF